MLFNSLPAEWKGVKLTDIASLNMGQSPSSSDVNQNKEGIAFFQGKAEFGKLYPTVKKYCTSPKKIAEAGDILLSVRAPVGPTNLADRCTAIGRGLAAIRSEPRVIEQRFLLYYLRCIEPWISQQGTGTTFKAISGHFLKELNAIAAPLAEQKVIADKLDSLLAQVENTKTRLDRIPLILKHFRQSVLAAAVSGRLTEEWRDGLGFNAKFKKLGDVGIEVKTGPFGSALHKSDYIHGGVPVINPMHIGEGTLLPSHNVTVSEEKYSELSAWHLKEGDIVVGRRGEMGRASIVKTQTSLLCGTGSMILRTGKSAVPKYLELILRSPTSIEYFTAASVGSTMVNLNQRVIKNLEIYFPSATEQTEIVRRVDQFFAHADTIEKQVKNAQSRINNLTQSILAKAFRGELTEQWRRDNPELISGENSAEALLARIRAEKAATQPAKRRRTR